MRTTTAGLTVSLAVPVLLLATACGGSDDGGSGGGVTKNGGTDPSASSSAHDARLERLALTASDLKGYTVSDQKPEGWASGQPKADDKRCQVLADATGDRPSDEVTEIARRGVARTADPSKGVTVALNGFAGKGAASYLSALKVAVSACGGGFATTLKGDKVDYPKVAERTTEPVGDEAFAYTLTAVTQGTTIPLDYVVVRSGSDIALFSGVDFKKFTSFEAPREVVEKQVEKLTAAGREG